MAPISVFCDGGWLVKGLHGHNPGESCLEKCTCLTKKGDNKINGRRVFVSCLVIQINESENLLNVRGLFCILHSFSFFK